MTINTFDPSGSERSPQIAAAGSHPRRGTIIGRETAYVTGLYLRRAFVFTGIILAIVLALDVVGRMTQVLALNDDATGLNGLLALLSYIGLRAAFVLPSALPIAAIMGVVWAEFGLSRSNERIMIFSSGRAPVRSLMPALIFGIVIGLLQFAAVNFSRPYSTEVQAQSKYRYYGPRFVSAALPNAKWFVTNDTVYNARIAFGPPVVLHDVVVYRLAPSGRLESIISADQAISNTEGDGWEFQNGTIFTFAWAQDGRTALKAPTQTVFVSRSFPVSLDPHWAEFIDIDPHLLPFKTLHNLAVADSGIPNSVAFRAAYQQRYAAILTCLAMALIGASLSLMMFAPQMAPTKLVQVAAIGYAAHVGSTVLKLLGEHGLVPLPVAIWMWPLAIIIGAYILLYWHDRRIQKAISDQAGQDIRQRARPAT